MDWRGLLIALAVIDGPSIGLGSHMDSAAAEWTMTRDPITPYGVALGVSFLFPWIFISPALADWITPHFDVGGVWQYLVLLAVLFLTAMTYWRLRQHAVWIFQKTRPLVSRGRGRR
jgi:hypothetical protein